jgi:hypothetical protein
LLTILICFLLITTRYLEPEYLKVLYMDMRNFDNVLTENDKHVWSL